MSDPPPAESWPRAAVRGFWLALWIIALLAVAGVVARAFSDWSSERGLPTLALCALFGAGLVGAPIVYRRAAPQATRWPATKRAWALAVAGLLVLAIVLGWAVTQLRGALPG